MLVRIANSDPKVLVAPQAFIAQQNNFDCSKLITKDQINLTPSTGYTIQLADPFNETHVSFLLPPSSPSVSPHDTNRRISVAEERAHLHP